MTAGNVDLTGELSIGLGAVSRPQKQMKDRGRLLLKSLAGLACVAYFATSAVVIANAFVWLPTMPSAWYQVQRILYWPFQPYFALASYLLGRSSISYAVYAVVTWFPFLLVSTAVAVALLRRHRWKEHGRE